MVYIYHIFIIHLSDEGHLHHFIFLSILSKAVNEHDCVVSVEIKGFRHESYLWNRYIFTWAYAKVGLQARFNFKELIIRISRNGYTTVQSTKGE